MDMVQTCWLGLIDWCVLFQYYSIERSGPAKYHVKTITTVIVLAMVLDLALHVGNKGRESLRLNCVKRVETGSRSKSNTKFFELVLYLDQTRRISINSYGLES